MFAFYQWSTIKHTHRVLTRWYISIVREGERDPLCHFHEVQPVARNNILKMKRCTLKTFFINESRYLSSVLILNTRLNIVTRIFLVLSSLEDVNILLNCNRYLQYVQSFYTVCMWVCVCVCVCVCIHTHIYISHL